jgi:hypothetical protein
MLDRPMYVLSCLACLVGGGLQSAMAGDLAFPGYSGFLNVPSATVLPHGMVQGQYSDQAFIRGEYGHYRNVSGAAGLLPLLEIGARISWEETQSNLFADGEGHRDLSANLKVRAPFIPEHWFTLAAGVQDIGGETGHFNAVYLVAGRRFGPLETAVGVGRPDVAGRYLDGAFAGVSWHATKWLNVLAEYDAADLRLGAGLASPQGWLPKGMQLRGKVLLWDQGDSDNDRQFFSLGVSLPLGQASDASRRREHPATMALPSQPSDHGSRVSPAQGAASHEESDRGQVVAPAVIGAALVAAGYERVAVGHAGDELVIRFENNLFNRDERMAFSDVAERLYGVAQGVSRVRVVLLNQGLPVATRQIWLDGDAPRITLADAAPLPAQWEFTGSYGPVWKPRVMLSPTISSGVATEYGVWDASVGVGAELSSSLWRGALASSTWVEEVYRTGDFEPGGIFYPDRQRNGLREAALQQALFLHPQLITSVQAGVYRYDFDGWVSETLWLSPARRHALGVLSGNFFHREFDSWQPRQMLGRYTWSWPEQDVQLTVHGGEFFAGDKGYRVDGRFWFGDYAITLTYKNTDAEFIGLGVVLPLTPVKDHQWRRLQLRGNPDWSYTVQSRINEDANLVSFGGAEIIRTANPLDRTYFNRLRLAP